MEYIPIPLQIGDNLVHTIYVRKEHSSVHHDDSDSEDEDNTNRTIFVTNLPLDTTADNMRDVCRALGDVVLDEYIFQGRRHGLISLVDESSASRFLQKAKKLSEKDSKKSSKKGKLIKWDHYGPKGAEGYLARHYANFPSEADLQEKVDDYMELFAEQELQEQLEAEEAAERVDADGFRLVVNKGRKRLADIPDASATAPAAKTKKRNLEKSDFYRFQLRDRRKHEMSDLLKRYQADKEKVEQLKQQRKFRPY